VIKESTRNFWKMQGEGARGLLRAVNMAHGYIYYTLYDRYVAVALSALRFLTRRFPSLSLTHVVIAYLVDHYHAKALTVENARKLVTLDRELLVPDGESKRIIPFDIANRLIFNHRDHIALVDCPCRLENIGRGLPACEPLNTCMFLGKTGVDFVTTHMPRMHGRRVSSREAAQLIETQYRRGVSFNLWFKDATGYRGGVLCSCCSCCCKGAEAFRIISQIGGLDDKRIVAPSGYAAKRDEAKCRACGGCAKACPYGALVFTDSPAERPIDFIYERCNGCGACVSVCENGAVALVRDVNKGEVLDVDRLVDSFT
jgi:Pyruvate/2-oxoacid:ferredoxin oxidoreductase delta subunit